MAARPERAADARRRRWQLGASITAVAAVAAILIAVTTSGSTSELKPGHPVPGTAATLALLRGIPQHGAALGGPRAPVTLVEFGDLQCPTCAQFATSAFPALVERFVRGGRVRVVFRAIDQIGADSTRAAQMAYALAGQGHMFEFVELAYKNQGLENSSYVTDTYLQALASAIPGADAGSALEARNAPAARAQLAESRALAARFRITGTPSFLLYRSGEAPRPLKPEGLDAASLSGPIERLLARAGG